MANGKTVLVVEDEADLAGLICYNLQREGYDCSHVADGVAAMDHIARSRPDLVVLDRMLPRLSGDEVAESLRRDPTTAGIPVVMLTAKVEESDQLVGFALGADDYVTKPFSMKVLLARVGALLKRSAESEPVTDLLTEGPFALDHNRHEVRVAGQQIQLTATEFRLLAALMSARGRVQDRARLIDRVLGAGAVVTDRTIDVHITALRKKVQAADPSGKAASWIQTIRGVGYAFRTPDV
jgi:two-component system phosphate regulon response regulator PhoB